MCSGGDHYSDKNEYIPVDHKYTAERLVSEFHEQTYIPVDHKYLNIW